jgi:hypothetical protein
MSIKKYMLFLSYDKDGFYDYYRSLDSRVTVLPIFKSDHFLLRVLRSFFLRFNFKIDIFLGSWHKNINQYDCVILPASLYSKIIANSIDAINQEKLVHWYWNPVSKSISPQLIVNNRSLVLSFDDADCEKYGLTYQETYYFSQVSLPVLPVEYDLLFVGADKQRATFLNGLGRKLTKLGITYNFHVVWDDTSTNKDLGYMGRITYSDMLPMISKCKALLDIPQAGQNGLTQRPLESIFLQRKLITTDATVKLRDFYNENNVFILDLDDLGALPNFLSTSFSPVDPEIVKKYSFCSWVGSVLKKRAHY